MSTDHIELADRQKRSGDMLIYVCRLFGIHVQIRKRGKRLLLIRSEYDPERKRSVGQTVASLKLGEDGAPVLPSKDLDRLNTEERAQWLDWYFKNQMERSKQRIKIMPEMLNRMRADLKQVQRMPGGGGLVAEVLDTGIKEELEALKQLIEEMGVSDDHEEPNLQQEKGRWGLLGRTRFAR